ncbi:YicC family protein [Thermosipho melanesiensis]|uniref:YicC N-terminal domain protein n=3 Tax=Thermosipho melanesiensis TaxID=46541 RepID=A6LJ77_THEM4|nr:YicC N-terminal domain protein [Thermosipho melanesiensis BI429]APT73182.1 hypothetical protein BW47_00550 [Thermosipho melanesiensis]
MKSMTGYAKVEKVSEKFKVSCEIKTLNSKGLDVFVGVPYYLSSKEIKINRIIANRIKRGKAYLRLNVKFLTPVDLNIDYVMAKSYFESLESLREQLGIQNLLSVGDLLIFKEIFRGDFSDEVVEELWEFSESVILDTLKRLVDEREKEGQKLFVELNDMIQKMKEIVESISSLSFKLKGEIAKKIRENVEEILPEKVELDVNQFETAVALIADKADIREEIARLKSHLTRLEELIRSDEPVGTLLNFLTQEVHREFNTILSKSRMLEITNYALEGKYINSQLKEQVQNIE